MGHEWRAGELVLICEPGSETDRLIYCGPGKFHKKHLSTWKNPGPRPLVHEILWMEIHIVHWEYKIKAILKAMLSYIHPIFKVFVYHFLISLLQIGKLYLKWYTKTLRWSVIKWNKITNTMNAGHWSLNSSRNYMIHIKIWKLNGTGVYQMN